MLHLRNDVPVTKATFLRYNSIVMALGMIQVVCNKTRDWLGPTHEEKLGAL